MSILVEIFLYTAVVISEIYHQETGERFVPYDEKTEKKGWEGDEEQAVVVILIPWTSFIDTHSIDFHIS